MEMVVTMDKFGRVMLPKSFRDNIRATKFVAKVEKGAVMLKPLPSLFDAIGMFPGIDMKKFRKQHQEDKSKDD